MTSTTMKGGLRILLLALLILAVASVIMAANSTLRATETTDAQYDAAEAVEDDTVYVELEPEKIEDIDEDDSTEIIGREEETDSAEDLEKRVTVSAQIVGGKYNGPGTVVKIVADLSNFDGVTPSLQWQVDKGNGWEDLPGEVGTELTVVVDNNLNYNYRVAASY